jgi:iron complex outermembrane receptor protein
LSTFAQNKITIRGTVTDQNNLSVINATVVEKGTANGTITDLDGNFSLAVSSRAAIVQISSIGYEKVEIPASEFDGIKKIRMNESAFALGEVVAIGYGQVRKNDATGSVVAIKAEEINKGLAVSPADLLVGKSAGVNVTTAGGAPGAKAEIRIRGGSSMSASNDPLIVVDGVPIDNRSIWGATDAISTINPNDIETFTVLKDASATAIYGSRASNGVIIITTKKGTAGAVGTTVPKVSYSGSISLNIPTRKIEMLSAQEFATMVKGKYGENSDQAKLLGNYNTDWQDQIFNTSTSSDHNLSLTGTLAGMPYRISGNLTGQNGILLNSKMNRGTIGVNLSPTFFKDALKVNLNFKQMRVENRFSDQGAIGAALEFNPTQPVYASAPYGNGYYISLDTKGKPIDIAIANPMSVLNEKIDKSIVNRTIANLQLDYKLPFLPELRANLNVGIDHSNSDGSVVTLENSSMSYSWGSIKNGTGENNPYGQKINNELIDFYLNYVKEVESIKSKFDVMGGYSWQRFYRNGWNNYNFMDGTQRLTPTDDVTESYIVSLFGRLNYTLLDRYLITATLRNDGSSRFAKENRWGLFPSVAFAWKIKEESFLRDVQVLSDLKLRLGYGVTGQQDITSNDYPAMARYQYSESGANYMFGNKVIPLVRPLGYDANIKWEETTTKNIGLDFGFLEGRITGAIDAYIRQTDDMINTVPVSAGTNFINELLTNVGSLENKGIEFMINTKPVVTKKFSWDLGFNIAYNQNKITKLTLFEDPKYIGVETGGISGGTGNKIQIHSVGYPVSSYYVMKQVYDEAGKPIEGAYVDLNGDGQISDADKYRFHKPAHDYIMGLSSKMLLGAWDLSFNARCNLGGFLYNNVQSKLEALNDSYDTSGFLKNRISSALNTNFNGTQYLSDYYIQDASFLRIDNITLGYSFDKAFNSNANLRLFVTAQNPVLITNYTGLDPEITGGIDNNIYPRPTIVLAGLTLNF